MHLTQESASAPPTFPDLRRCPPFPEQAAGTPWPSARFFRRDRSLGSYATLQ
jgi:hypothetical protein